jgi:hypothetical protein
MTVDVQQFYEVGRVTVCGCINKIKRSGYTYDQVSLTMISTNLIKKEIHTVVLVITLLSLISTTIRYTFFFGYNINVYSI